MVSICDFYRKTDRRLTALEKEGYWFNRDADSSPEVATLLKDIATIAARYDMEVFTCAEEVNFSTFGIRPGMCIDNDLVRQIWSISVCSEKDSSQREHCRCVVSKDIGMNDTCMHGCQYCYSTRNNELAERRHSEHNPDSPVLWGSARPLTEAEQAPDDADCREWDDEQDDGGGAKLVEEEDDDEDDEHECGNDARHQRGL